MPITVGPRLPSWVPPAGDINALADASLTKQSVAAPNTPLAVIYGRDKVQGKLGVVHVDDANGFLYLAILWCTVSDAIEKVYVDGVLTSDGTDGLVVKGGEVENHEAGGPSALLAAAIPGYADNLAACYTVLKIPKAYSRSFPRIEAIVRGKKIYDPRSGLTVWSDNPVLAARDVAVGAGWAVNDTDVQTAANSCDSPTIGGLKPRLLGLTLSEPRAPEEWMNVFRTYTGCFIAWENGQIRFIPDKAVVLPGDRAAALTTDNIVEGTISLRRKSPLDLPTVCIVEYRDSTNDDAWRTDRAVYTEVGLPARVTRVSLPGIHRYSQAYREAFERIKKLQTDLVVGLKVDDSGLKLQIGSVVSVVHPLGLNGDFRIIALGHDQGRWDLTLIPYDAAAYSSANNSNPTTWQGTELGSPESPLYAAITGYLTNESHSVATAADGSGGDYSAAGGIFAVFSGLADVTGDPAVTYSVVGGSVTGGLSISIGASGAYTVSGLTDDLGSATLRALYAGVPVDKVYSLSKSKAGVNSKSLRLSATSQIFTYDGAGAASPGGQSIVFTAYRENLTDAVVFSTSPAVTLSGTGDTRTLAIADFGANTAVTVTASCEGYEDKITVVRVSAGSTATAFRLLSEGQAFRFSGSGTNIGVNTIGFDVGLSNLSGTAGFKVHNYRSDGTGISSYDLAGAGNANRILHVNSFVQNGSTAYATVVASLSGGHTDQITVHRLQDGVGGQDAIVGYLTNEAHTVPASANGFVTGYGGALGQYILNKGANPINTNSLAFSIAGNPQTLTASISNVGSYIVEGGFLTGTELATLTLRAAYDGSNYDKVFTLGKNKAGVDGTTARVLTLVANGQQFRYSGSATNIGVSTIGFDILLEGLAGTAGVYANNFRQDGTLLSSYQLSGAGNLNRGLHINSFTQNNSTAYATVVASIAGGFYDRITVVRVQEGATGAAGTPGADGASSIAGYLTNEAHSVPASSNGFIPAYTGAVGQFRLFEGIDPVSTNSITFTSSHASPAAMAGSISAVGSYIVSSLDPGTNLGLLALRAAYKGVNVDKVFTLTKAKAGTDGSTGANAQLLALMPTGQTFQYSGSGTAMAPNTVGFLIDLENITGTAAIYANNFRADGVFINSVALAGPVSSNWLFHINSFTQGGSTAYATVVASVAGGFSDRVTVIRLQDGPQGAQGVQGAVGSQGVAAVTALLTNEAHTIPASSNGVVATAAYSGAAGYMVLYEGNSAVLPNSVTFSIPTNPQSLNMSFAANSGFYNVNNNMSSHDLAVVTLRGQFKTVNYDKVFTVAKSRGGAAGANGEVGSPAPLLNLRATAQMFRYSGSGTALGVNTIGFDADLTNLSGTIGIYANNFRSDGTLLSSYQLSGAGNTGRGLHINSFTQNDSTAYATVVASLTGGYTDRITVVRLQEGPQGATGAVGSPGVPAIVGYLTNEAHTVPASTNGFIPAYTGAVGQFRVFEGVDIVSANSITFASSNVSPVAMAGSISAIGSYIVSSLDPGTDLGLFALRATYKSVNIDKVFTLAKSKGGVTGTPGTDAKALNLLPTAQSFRYSGSGTVIAPNTIGFFIGLENITGPAAIYANNFLANGTFINSVALAGPVSSNWLFHINSFTQGGSTAYATVVASVTGGFFDRVSVIRLQDGPQGGQGPTGPAGPPGVPAASMILNGGFETGDNTGWAIAPGTIVNSAAGAYAGNYYVQIPAGAGGPDHTTVKYPAIPGEVYRFAVMVRPDYTTAPTSPCFFGVRAYYDNGTQISYTTIGSDHAPSSAAWRPMIGEYTVPVSAAYIAPTIGETAAGGGFWLFDELTGILKGDDGVDGVDPVAGYLTNEAHTLPASNNGFVPAYTGAVGQFRLFKGINPVATSSITFTSSNVSPAAMAGSISAVGSYIVSSLDPGTDLGVFALRAAFDGVNIDKVFTLSKSKGGATGGSGAAAQVLNLSPTAQSFRYSGSGTVIAPNTIGFFIGLENIAGTAAVYANNFLANGTLINSVALAGPVSSNWLFNVNSFTRAGSTAYATVVASIAGGFFDRVTVVRLQDGPQGAEGTPGAVGSPGLDGYPRNLTPPTFTDVLSTNMGGWYRAVGSGQNAEIHNDIPDPYGSFTPVLRVRWPDVNTTQIGSSTWLYQIRHNFKVEQHKSYVSYVAFMVSSGANRAYAGYTDASSTIQRVDGSSSSNEYFVPGPNGLTLPASRWYLGVGIWHPSSKTSDSGLQGYYDFQTGSKVYNGPGIRVQAESHWLRTGVYIASGGYVNSASGVCIQPLGTFAMDDVYPTIESVLNRLAMPGLVGYLTNENHTLPSSSNGFVTSPFSVGGAFVLMEGVNSVNVSSIAFSTAANPQALTHVFSTNGTFRVTAGFATGDDTAALTLRAAYRSVNVDKVFSLGKSKGGIIGNDAKSLGLYSTAQAFRYSGSGTNIGVNTIGFNIAVENIAGTAAIYANNFRADNVLINSVALAGPVSSQWLFNINSFTQNGSTAYATVVASLAGYTDRTTVIRLQEGAAGQEGAVGPGGLVAYLTNEVHTLPASSNGFVPSYSGANGAFVLMEGVSSVSINSISYSTQFNSGTLTHVFSLNGTFAVTAGLDPGEPYGALGLRATYKATNVDKVFTLAKSIGGIVGAPGSAGNPGGIGAPGANILANGDMTYVDSITGKLAYWTGMSSYHSYGNQARDGGRCMIVTSNGGGPIWNDSIIPVSPLDEAIEVSVWMRSVNSGQRVYMYLDCLDANGYSIQPAREQLRGFFKLESAANAGATSVRVYKPNSWDHSFPGYVNSSMRVLCPVNSCLALPSLWPHSMDLHETMPLIESVNTAASATYDTLNFVAGQTLPVSMSALQGLGFGLDSSTYRYWGVGDSALYVTVSSTWQEYKARFAGLNTPLLRHVANQTAQTELRTFRQGAKFLKFGLGYNTGGGTQTLYLDDFVVQRREHESGALVRDPYGVQGGGAWVWQSEFSTLAHSYNTRLRFSPTSGPTGNGMIVCKVGSALYDVNRISSKI